MAGDSRGLGADAWNVVGSVKSLNPGFGNVKSKFDAHLPSLGIRISRH
jgi:hypothetical protein